VQVLFSVTEKSAKMAETTPWTLEPGHANGTPAILRRVNGQVDFVITLAPGVDGRIAWLYIMRNPDKLPA
jgi:RNA polymerase sigma-70 factor (ECF subfamily)